MDPPRGLGLHWSCMPKRQFQGSCVIYRAERYRARFGMRIPGVRRSEGKDIAVFSQQGTPIETSKQKAF